MSTATIEPPGSRHEVTVETATVALGSSRDLSSDLPSDEGRVPPVLTECRQPPVFKDLIRSRLDKFSGKPGEGDFEIFLEDYLEATQNCGRGPIGSLCLLLDQQRLHGNEPSPQKRNHPGK